VVPIIAAALVGIGVGRGGAVRYNDDPGRNGSYDIYESAAADSELPGPARMISSKLEKSSVVGQA
jgi:hypothetical protein